MRIPKFDKWTSCNANEGKYIPIYVITDEDHVIYAVFWQATSTQTNEDMISKKIIKIRKGKESGRSIDSSNLEVGLHLRVSKCSMSIVCSYSC